MMSIFTFGTLKVHFDAHALLLLLKILNKGCFFYAVVWLLLFRRSHLSTSSTTDIHYYLKQRMSGGDL